MKRNKDIGSVAFWDAVDRASARVATWPEWKKNVRVTMYSKGLIGEGK